MVDLGTLGGSESNATAFNNSGQVIGTSATSSGSGHAFLWTKKGGMLDLGTLGGTRSHAAAVNNLGQVVGEAETSTGSQRAFSWTRAGGMVDLGTLGGTNSYATAVNNSGQVVGGTDYCGQPFSWTQAAAWSLWACRPLSREVRPPPSALPVR
jgi:probable HAF family extracellular repeat protein